MDSTNKCSMPFDQWVAQYYVSKINYCANNGIDFKLNLISVRNLLAARVCHYTGVLLTVPNGNKRATDITIDRLDNSKGYVKGNVVACCDAANNFKSLLENPKSTVKIKDAEKIIKKLKSIKK